MDIGAQLFVLLSTRDKIKGEIAIQKASLEEIERSIETASKDHVDAAFQRAGKPDGTVRFAVGNRMFKAAISKTVKYDNAKLEQVAGSVPWEQAREIFKIDFDVPEKAFKAITDKDLKRRITDARTVKYSAPKITEED